MSRIAKELNRVNGIRRLPRMDGLGEPGSSRAPLGGPLRGKSPLHVLVAGADKAAVDRLSILVEELGHIVRRAYDEASALELNAAHQPNVLLVDDGLGRRLAWWLRRQPC